MAKSPADIARENALVVAASKFYPGLELECEGKRAICVGGHEDHIDSINVYCEGKVMLISEWVLEHCLQLSEESSRSEAEERRLTLTSAYVVAYGNQHVPKTPLLQWCREMCAANGLSSVTPGTRLLVFWWDMEHSKQADKLHMRGRSWWPATNVAKYPKLGVWFSARVVRYDPKRVTLHVVYEYNEPAEMETGKLILPLNYVHFGSAPPPAGGRAQVLPPPWQPPSLQPRPSPAGPQPATKLPRKDSLEEQQQQVQQKNAGQAQPPKKKAQEKQQPKPAAVASQPQPAAVAPQPKLAAGTKSTAPATTGPSQAPTPPASQANNSAPSERMTQAKAGLGRVAPTAHLGDPSPPTAPARVGSNADASAADAKLVGRQGGRTGGPAAVVKSGKQGPSKRTVADQGTVTTGSDDTEARSAKRPKTSSAAAAAGIAAEPRPQDGMARLQDQPKQQPEAASVAAGGGQSSKPDGAAVAAVAARKRSAPDSDEDVPQPSRKERVRKNGVEETRGSSRGADGGSHADKPSAAPSGSKPAGPPRPQQQQRQSTSTPPTAQALSPSPHQPPAASLPSLAQQQQQRQQKRRQQEPGQQQQPNSDLPIQTQPAARTAQLPSKPPKAPAGKAATANVVTATAEAVSSAAPSASKPGAKPSLPPKPSTNPAAAPTSSAPSTSPTPARRAVDAQAPSAGPLIGDQPPFATASAGSGPNVGAAAANAETGRGGTKTKTGAKPGKEPSSALHGRARANDKKSPSPTAPVLRSSSPSPTGRAAQRQPPASRPSGRKSSPASAGGRAAGSAAGLSAGGSAVGGSGGRDDLESMGLSAGAQTKGSGKAGGGIAAGDLAAGPTSRVRWPGSKLMLADQIAGLVSAPAAIPLPCPRCDAHVAALEALAAERGGGAREGSVQLQLPPPAGDSDDEDHLQHFLSHPQAPPPQLADLATSPSPPLELPIEDVHTMDVDAEPAGTDATAAAAAAVAPPTLAGSLGALCDTMHNVSNVVESMSLQPSPEMAATNAPTAPEPPAQEGAGASGTSDAARGGVDSSWEDADDSDGAFKFIDEGQYHIVLPPPERLAAYEALGRGRGAVATAAAAGTSAAAAPTEAPVPVV